MVPFHSADAPSADPGVLKRMKRVHPHLRLTFSPYSLDLLTGQPIEMDTGQPVLDPCWYLWILDGATNHHIHVNMFPVEEGGFGHRNCLSLESDIGRHMKPSEISAWLRSREESMRGARHKATQADQQDKIAANKRRIHDLIFEGKSGIEESTTYSYAGQSNRTSSAERAAVLKDAREDGWELPER